MMIILQKDDCGRGSDITREDFMRILTTILLAAPWL